MALFLLPNDLHSYERENEISQLIVKSWIEVQTLTYLRLTGFSLVWRSTSVNGWSRTVFIVL